MNRSTYNSKMLRAGPGASAERSEPFGHVNDYWIQRRKQREAASAKRQAASNKQKNTLTLFK